MSDRPDLVRHYGGDGFVGRRTERWTGPVLNLTLILERESQCVGAATIYFVRKLGAFC